MTPLVEKALEYLSVTCNKAGLHPLDEDNIKVTLRALHKKGEILDAQEIRSWVTGNGWSSMPAKDVSQWAGNIARGGRVQLKNKMMAPTEKDVLRRINQ